MIIRFIQTLHPDYPTNRFFLIPPPPPLLPPLTPFPPLLPT